VQKDQWHSEKRENSEKTMSGLKLVVAGGGEAGKAAAATLEEWKTNLRGPRPAMKAALKTGKVALKTGKVALKTGKVALKTRKVAPKTGKVALKTDKKTLDAAHLLTLKVHKMDDKNQKEVRVAVHER
jgi:hypothetical protein